MPNRLRWFLAPCFALGLSAAEGAKTHLDYARESEAAYLRKDYAAAREASYAALELRPDSPRYLYNLAALSARLDEKPAALNYLHRLAALGVVMPIQRDPDFAPLQGSPDFFKIQRELNANLDPRGAATLFAELPDRTGIIEGIAFRDRTGDLFLSDVHQRCIWRRDRTGQMTRFTVENEELMGLFGLRIDEPRNTLWAAMAAVPEMEDYQPALKGQAALAEFDLGRGDLRRVIPIPPDGRDHMLGDLLLSEDGTIYASDSLAPVIWKLTPGEEDFEKLVDSSAFGSLQGMVLRDNTLVVADYSNGLIAIDTKTGQSTELLPPKDVTLLGIDGMVRAGDNLIAVQNGVNPQRVLRIALSPRWDAVAGVNVLASGLPDLTDLSLLTFVEGRAIVVAGAGWDTFDPKKAKHPAAHAVRLFQVPIP